MLNLLGMLGVLLACIGGLLLVMRWNVRRSLAPLGGLLGAIARVEQNDLRALRALPAMPIRELEAVAAALRHLAQALATAEGERRLLVQQALTLQEDERHRLARDLHDEFGQRLTALRVDAAWLARRVAEQPALRQVVDGMSAQCERVQLDIRALLTRLQPFGPAGEGGREADGESLYRLVALLRALVASWSPPGRDSATRYQLLLQWQAADGAPQAWPDGPLAEALRLPRALALTLYRISQEALTNVARHAHARSAELRLHCRGEAAPGAALHLAWSVRDDGVGLPDEHGTLQRGNGLAGIQERAWAQGGDLRIGPAQPGSPPVGLCLEAGFDARLLDAAAPPASPPGD
jgi:two-component system sensor histidine kinase UhpB